MRTPPTRWIDREPHATANREVDRLVQLVSGQGWPIETERIAGRGASPASRDAEVVKAQSAFLDRELPGWSSRRVDWSGGETQVIEAGEGEPILMVHGGMGNAADFAPLMARLARTRHVIAVDRPGHGLASPFDYRGLDLWRHGAAYLTEVADLLGLSTVDIVANSMGGMWAIAMAEARPERIRHLVLVGAPAGSQRWLPPKVGVLAWPVLGSLVTAVVRRGTVESTRSFWDGTIVTHPERLSGELLEFATLAARRNVGTWVSLVRNFASVRGVRARYLIEDHLRRVDVPLTFVLGDRDAFDTPVRVRRLAATATPPRRVVVIAGAGHLPWIEDADRVADAVLDAVSRGIAGQQRGRESGQVDQVAS